MTFKPLSIKFSLLTDFHHRLKLPVALFLWELFLNFMTQGTIKILQPFKIHIDPMERLLLVNFEKDPDSIYLGFEPQVFEDSVHGKGHLIIAWRVDGKVDVYHQPGLTLDPSTYDIAGKGLENMVVTTFSKAFYEIDDLGVQAQYTFKDKQNRTIAIRINEKNPKKPKPFGLLAPMGDAAEFPSALPLVLLHDFYFVRKRHTEIEVTIAGKNHQPDLLPVPMDFSKMYFTRYSQKPLIATMNPAYNGKLIPLNIEREQKTISNNEYDIVLQWKNNEAFIKQIIWKNKVYPVNLEFKDPFPNLLSAQKENLLKGKFFVEAHHSTGRLSGDYFITRKNSQTEIIMIPTGGWHPRPTKLSLWFLYTVARIFKKWPTSYKWTAFVSSEKDNTFVMESKWERI